MKQISRKTVSEYMSVIVSECLKRNATALRTGVAPLDGLCTRPDAAAVLRLLCASGYIRRMEQDPNPVPLVIHVTDKGLTYFIDERERLSNLRWSRGLSIAAIVVSIGSLVLSLLSLCSR